MLRLSPPTSGALLLILGGVLLTTIGGRAHGFLGGAAQGAGVMLLLGGVWVLGASRRRPGAPDAAWLPSRDGER